MILGISGRMGSGKDTVAKILQYFTLPEELRTISMDEWVYELSYQPDISENLSTHLEIRKFADKLKDCIALILNIPRWKLEVDEYKQQLLPKHWDRWILAHEQDVSIHQTKEEAQIIVNYLRLPEDEYVLERQSLTVRDMLQMLGTDVMRDIIHPNVWVNGLYESYQPIGSTNIAPQSAKLKKIIREPVWPSWVITDVRFPNELDCIKNGLLGKPIPKNDFRFLVRVNRPDRNLSYTNQTIHPSETALDEYLKWDYVIDNTGTLDDLAFEVHTMLKSNKEFEKYFYI